MTELPKGWTVATMGDLLLAIQAGKSLKCEERPPKENERGVVKVSAVTWGTFDAAQSKTLPKSFEPMSDTAIKAGDFLFSRANTLELVGAVVLVRNDHPNLFLSDKILRLDLDPALKPWLLKYLQSLEGKRKLAAVSTGNQASMRNIGQNELKSVSIPLPPLNEQRRIVEKIEAMFERIDKGVENLRGAKATLALYRQSLLKSGFEGKLTADWRAQNADKLETPKTLLARIQKERETRYKSALDDWQTFLSEWRANGEVGRKPSKPSRPEDVAPLEPHEKAAAPTVPPEWAVSRMGLYIDWIEAGKSFKCLELEPTVDQIGVAKVSAVSWGEYKEAESKTCLDPDMVNETLFINEGDFLFSRANTIELVGAAVIVKKVTKRVMLSDKTLRIYFSSENQRFFLYYFRSPFGRAEIEERSTGNQESMRNIGQERIRNIVVPICSPAEQAEITRILDARLTAADAMEAEINSALLRAEALRQSILKQAFAGTLVPQDPTDEPAPTLLARIKAERAKAGKTKPRKTVHAG